MACIEGVGLIQYGFIFHVCFQWLVIRDVWHDESECFPLVSPFTNTLILLFSTLLCYVLFSQSGFCLPKLFLTFLCDVFSHSFCPYKYMFSVFLLVWFWRELRIDALAQYTCVTRKFIFIQKSDYLTWKPISVPQLPLSQPPQFLIHVYNIYGVYIPPDLSSTW